MTYSKNKCTDEKIIEACSNSKTMSIASVKCGIHFNTFKRRAIKLNCYNPNQGGKGTYKPKPKIPLERILGGKEPQYQTYKLKNRLIEEEILCYECLECGLKEWNGKPISLELDHINGNSNDHILDNLRLLCPNCHSQTETFRSKKRK